MSFSADSSELRQLTQNLGRVGADALGDVDKVLKRGVQNMKTEMVEDIRASPSFKSMAGAISYDSDYRLGQVGYVLGPDKGRRGGALGNIYYFGTSRGGGTGDLDKPLRNEAPRLEKALGDLMGEIGNRL